MMILCSASNLANTVLPSGGNPLACQVALAALEVVREENLMEKAAYLGEIFRAEMKVESEMVSLVRGKGLLNAIVIQPKNGRRWDVCVKMKELEF